MARFTFLTFHKCGSQWIRDVLTSPHILSEAGIQRSAIDGVNLHVTSSWPTQEHATFLGPIYNASYQDWVSKHRDGDKTLVVLRDPRDIIVSRIHSIAFSHTPQSPVISLNREIALSLSERNRMIFGFSIFYMSGFAFSSWVGRASTNAYVVTSYENLIADPVHEFMNIVRFYDWKIPESLMRESVEMLSFKTRSGRDPGEENKYSHYRKGVAGDWKKYFDRRTGRLFEETFPNLLCNMGLEHALDWYQALPQEVVGSEQSAEPVEVHELRAALVRVQEENQWLKRICEERQTVIDQLAQVCDERLQLINRLNQ